MYEKFTHIKGKELGPTSIILAGVHGNETCGIQAFQEILPSLKIDKGDVWFGYGNPKAIEKNLRFTEANLNRLFKLDTELSEEEKRSYEYGRAQAIKKYLNKAEVLLDIHASNTLDSPPFVICEPNASEIAHQLPFELVVSGFDKIQPGGTDYYMNRIGKTGISIECGYIGDRESTKKAIKSIFAFLRFQGHISMETSSQKQKKLAVYQLYRTQSSAFTLAQTFSDFQEIAKGETIAMDDNLEITAPKDSLILFARNRSKIGEEGFILIEKK
jgi:succinylglutamate desuccinylase